MAQADDSAPRKTTTYKRFEGMASQNERYNTKPDEMFWLENIMRVSPKRLHSVPGPIIRTTVPIPPSGCPIDTVPTGPQLMTQVFCYNYDTGAPPGTLPGPSASQVDFIAGKSPNEEFIATASVSDGFLAPYPRADWEVMHIMGTTISAATPVPLPPGDAFNYATQTRQAGVSGHSDEMCYLIIGDYTKSGSGTFGGVTVYFSWPSQTVTVLNEGLTDGTTGTWAKHGTNFWRSSEAGSIYRWDLSNPFASSFVAHATGFLAVMSTIQATDNFLWTHDAANSLLYKLDLSTMAIVASYSLAAVNIYVAGDDLIYNFTTSGADFTFSYFIPSTNTNTAIGIINSNCMTPSTFTTPSVMKFAAGYFYISQGFGPFGPGGKTVKIGPLVCPNTDIPIGN